MHFLCFAKLNVTFKFRYLVVVHATIYICLDNLWLDNGAFLKIVI